MGALSRAGSGSGPPESGTAADQRAATDAPATEDQREDRRVHRWAVVVAGLVLALGAVAFGAWWIVLGLMAVSLCGVMWALSA